MLKNKQLIRKLINSLLKFLIESFVIISIIYLLYKLFTKCELCLLILFNTIFIIYKLILNILFLYQIFQLIKYYLL